MPPWRRCTLIRGAWRVRRGGTGQQQDGLGQRQHARLQLLTPNAHGHGAGRELTEEGQLWVQYVSSTPATRLDVITLQERLDQQLQQRQARGWGWQIGERCAVHRGYMRELALKHHRARS